MRGQVIRSLNKTRSCFSNPTSRFALSYHSRTAVWSSLLRDVRTDGRLQIRNFSDGTKAQADEKMPTENEIETEKSSPTTTSETEPKSPADLNMISVKMPSMHDGMEVGKLTEWCKEVGDKVKVGETLCEIETEVAFVEFEAQASGYLAAKLVEPGDKKILIDEAIALIVHKSEDVKHVQRFLKDYTLSEFLDKWHE